MDPTIQRITLDDLADPAPPPGPADWNDHGVVFAQGLIPDDLIAAYADEWMEANGFEALESPPAEHAAQWAASASEPLRERFVLRAKRPGGWDDTCPYMDYPALRELVTYGPLAELLEATVGVPMGVHLNLTGWVSTQRLWHQDGYLNPASGPGDRYAAVWIALGDIDPDAGPFEYVPGSHRWHRLTKERLAETGIVDVNKESFPADSEKVLTPLVEAEIERRGATVASYVPNMGDVLLWHPRLYHQGSPPLFENAYRPALIAHYSSIHHRPDMPRPAVRQPGGGWMFPIEQRPGMGRA